MPPAIADASSLTSLVVGLIALVMAVLALRARGRSGNRKLLCVAAAFGLFVVKSVFSAYNVQTHAVPHDLIELGLSLFDLAIIGLLFLPFVVKA
jgi:hypothetical protein